MIRDANKYQRDPDSIRDLSVLSLPLGSAFLSKFLTVHCPFKMLSKSIDRFRIWDRYFVMLSVRSGLKRMLSQTSWMLE